MTREGMNQVKNLVSKIEEIEQEWIKMVDEWSEIQIGELPSLPRMVESQLNHLRGLDAKKASEYDWMLIV